jgi:hypothetical protein
LKTVVTSFSPTLVTSREEIAGFLADLRYGAGLTGEDLDDTAGWADRYTGKLESGMKKGFIIEPGAIRMSAMAETWLQCFNACLVLMTTAQAQEIGAVSCPPRSGLRPPHRKKVLH